VDTFLIYLSSHYVILSELCLVISYVFPNQVHDEVFGQREEKGESGLPKITFRLGPASPRPPTPDAQPRKM
jgi:hypothetical protein